MTVASEQIEDALDAFVRSKQKGTDSGNYQRREVETTAGIAGL